MTLTMYDSVNWEAIPTDVEAVAGYVDGAYVWPQAAWDRFPGAHKVTIATRPTSKARALDVERGDALPSQAPGWIDSYEPEFEGDLPWVYCSLDTCPQVIQACGGRAYRLWVADYTGVPHLEPGSVATQYANSVTSGGDYDLSLCEDIWTPIPTPIPSQEDEMAIYAKSLPATPGAHVLFSGLYNGKLPNGKVRRCFVSGYCDMADADIGVTLTIFTQGPDGNQGGQQTLVLTPSKDTGDVEITWAQGNFGMAVYTDGRQPAEVAVKTEDW